MYKSLVLVFSSLFVFNDIFLKQNKKKEIMRLEKVFFLN